MKRAVTIKTKSVPEIEQRRANALQTSPRSKNFRKKKNLEFGQQYNVGKSLERLVFELRND